MTAYQIAYLAMGIAGAGVIFVASYALACVTTKN